MGEIIKRASEILAQHGIEMSEKGVAEWMLGGEVVDITAEELAQQIAEWCGVTI